MELSKQYEKVLIVTDAASSDITGKSCSPYTAHWTYDTYSNAHTVGSAIVKNGGDSWFFLTADYVFGHSIERDTGDVVRAAGGKVLGSVKHPLNTADFSSFLLQAQASKAKIIGLANGGGDTINAIKQAGEFGIVAGGQNLAAIVMFISDVHSLGLKVAQGLIITEAYYWDLNDQTRAFGKRFQERVKRMPTMNQAATYSATAAITSKAGRPPAPRTPRRCWRRCAKRRCTMLSRATARCAKTAAWCTACSCSRSRSPRNPRDHGTITSCSPKSPATRRSVRSIDGGCPLVK